MKKSLLGLILVGGLGLAPARAASDLFEPDMTMYSFADLWLVRPMNAAMTPLTGLTYLCSLPFTSGSD